MKFTTIACAIAALSATFVGVARAEPDIDKIMNTPAYSRRDGPPPGTVGSRYDANGNQLRGGQVMRDQRDDPRRDERGDPRGDPRRDARGDPRRDTRGDQRANWRDDRGQWHQRDGHGAGPERGWYRGDRLPPEYRNRQYVVDDWRGHQLRRPPSGYHWVQSGGDYILAAIATGVIVDLILNH